MKRNYLLIFFIISFGIQNSFCFSLNTPSFRFPSLPTITPYTYLSSLQQSVKFPMHQNIAQFTQENKLLAATILASTLAAGALSGYFYKKQKAEKTKWLFGQKMIEHIIFSVWHISNLRPKAAQESIKNLTQLQQFKSEYPKSIKDLIFLLQGLVNQIAQKLKREENKTKSTIIKERIELAEYFGFNVINLTSDPEDIDEEEHSSKEPTEHAIHEDINIVYNLANRISTLIHQYTKQLALYNMNIEIINEYLQKVKLEQRKNK